MNIKRSFLPERSWGNEAMKWNAGLYDTKHDFVSKYGEDVVALLNPKAGERILDVGCGTGDLTAIIAEAGAIAEGIDLSETMIEQAQQKFPFIHFRVADITTFKKPGYFDAVFSNATLHWVTDKTAAAAMMYENLKPGGRLVVEFGGKGNVQEIITAIHQVLAKNRIEVKETAKLWYFPPLGAYTTVLENVGFTVDYAWHFDRETVLKSKEDGIKDWIRMFGSYYFEGLEEQLINDLLEEIQRTLTPGRFYDGSWHADYKRLRVVARKPH